MAVLEAFKTHSSEPPAALAGARPVLWLSFVCLDAPLVAVTWQLFFARSFHETVTILECGALFLTAWGIYLADRLVDALTLRQGGPVSARAAFCRQHQSLLVTLLGFIAVADLVVGTRLPWWLIGRGVALGVFAAAYLLVNQRAHQLWRVLPIKEVVVGFLFAFGTALFLFPRMPPANVTGMVLLFAVLCSLNTLSIAGWERELDLKQRKHSFATERAGAGKIVRLLCLVLVLVGCSLALDGFEPLLNGAIAISSALLLALHFASIRTDERTALADLVLLTPIVFLFTR